MNLKTRCVLLVLLAFSAILASSYGLFRWLAHDTLAGLGTLYTSQQVLYNRARTLQPLLRELALARKLATSSALHGWAGNESDPTLRAAALRELDEYRQFFADGSFFLAIHTSGHYYYNNRSGRYSGQELRYTLDPDDPEDHWYYGTVASGEPYQLNVDFDEKLQVTKVWINVVVRAGDEVLGVVGTGLDLSSFLTAVTTSEQPGVTNIFVEQGGAIQAHDQRELIDFRSISKAPTERKTIFQLLDRQPDRDRLRQAMQRLQRDSTVEVLVAPAAGQRHLIGLAYLPEIGWFNVTLVDAERMLGVRRFLPFALLLLAALGALCAALVFLLDRVVLRRVARLDQSVRAFAAGCLPTPLRPPHDEIGRLEQGFEQMAASVQQHTSQLELKVEERTRELAAQNASLQQALAEIRTLSGLLPTCMYCKKIRDEDGHWATMEEYIGQRSGAEFSHGICPDCYATACREEGLSDDPR